MCSQSCKNAFLPPKWKKLNKNELFFWERKKAAVMGIYFAASKE